MANVAMEAEGWQKNNMLFWYESLFWLKIRRELNITTVIIMSKCVNPKVYPEVYCEVWQ